MPLSLCVCVAWCGRAVARSFSSTTAHFIAPSPGPYPKTPPYSPLLPFLWPSNSSQICSQHVEIAAHLFVPLLLQFEPGPDYMAMAWRQLLCCPNAAFNEILRCSLFWPHSGFGSPSGFRSRLHLFIILPVLFRL